jgi:N-acetylneuraminate lyase
MTELHGILPALVTPFDDEGAFYAPAFERLLERVYAAGAHGVYVCGQTGEGLLQSVTQRKRAAEVALRYSPRGKQVIIHTGAHSTADAVELTRHASTSGAAAVSSLPPTGPYSFADVYGYYQAIASVSDVPVLVYYFPEVSGAVSSPEQIEDLCGIQNVAGLKFTDFDLFTLSRLTRSGRIVFNGRDEVFAAGMLMGAHGGIGTFYNLVPELFVQVYEAGSSGRWAEARLAQDRINDLIAILIRYPLFPAVKTVLRWSGLDCGGCLGPRRLLTSEQHDALRHDLTEAGFQALIAATEHVR